MVTDEIESYVDEVLDKVPVGGGRRQILRREIEDQIRRVREALREEGVHEAVLVPETLSRIGTADRLARRLRDRVHLGRTRSLRMAGAGLCLAISLAVLTWAILRRWDLVASVPGIRLAWVAAVHIPLLGAALALLWQGRVARSIGVVATGWLFLFFVTGGWGLPPGFGVAVVILFPLSFLSLAVAISLWRLAR